MPLLFAPWLIALIAVLTQVSGGLTIAGNILTGTDKAINATIDIKKMFTPIVIHPIKPVVLPKQKKKVN